MPDYTVTRFLLTRLLRGATYFCKECSSAFYISTHAPLARRDNCFFKQVSVFVNFYSHASCEARLSVKYRSHQQSAISTHTPLARRDVNGDETALSRVHFYSHASCEARRMFPCLLLELLLFLLTRLLRGATGFLNGLTENGKISTHTPLARRDELASYDELWRTDFYSHASCEARRLF